MYAEDLTIYAAVNNNEDKNKFQNGLIIKKLTGLINGN